MDRQKRKTRRGQYRLDNPNIKLYNIILYLFLKKKRDSSALLPRQDVPLPCFP